MKRVRYEMRIHDIEKLGGLADVEAYCNDLHDRGGEISHLHVHVAPRNRGSVIVTIARITQGKG